MFSPGHDDAVAGSHVVQQEITEGMKGFLAQGVWDRKCTAVDLCACWRGVQGSDVTD